MLKINPVGDSYPISDYLHFYRDDKNVLRGEFLENAKSKRRVNVKLHTILSDICNNPTSIVDIAYIVTLDRHILHIEPRSDGSTSVKFSYDVAKYLDDCLCIFEEPFENNDVKLFLTVNGFLPVKKGGLEFLYYAKNMSGHAYRKIVAENHKAKKV